MSQSDPTDHALAAIASILDHPEAPPVPVPEKTAVEDVPIAPIAPQSPPRGAAEGYHRFGPGPMAAIRFKWTVRRDDHGDYYVDETIGENSTPVVTGPMSGDDAVTLVDDRESEARRRFEALRSEMVGRGAAASLIRKDDGEI